MQVLARIGFGTQAPVSLMREAKVTKLLMAKDIKPRRSDSVGSIPSSLVARRFAATKELNRRRSSDSDPRTLKNAPDQAASGAVWIWKRR